MCRLPTIASDFFPYLISIYIYSINKECRHISNVLAGIECAFRGTTINKTSRMADILVFIYFLKMSRGYFLSPLHTSALLVFLKMSDSHPLTTTATLPPPPPLPLLLPTTHPHPRKNINLNDVKIIISQII